MHRYRQKVSGPLLDRIDLHVEVPAVALQDLKGALGESTQSVAARVASARDHQRKRSDVTDSNTWNAAMSPPMVRETCRLEPSAQQLLDRAFEKLGLSARAVHRVLKVSRTLADLSGSSRIRTPHVAEAIQYRSLDRRLEG